MAAENRSQTLSSIATDLIDRALTDQEEAHWQRIYGGLKRLKGSGSAGVTDASTTIDETLYGEQGAWQGDRE
jgi:hypothetical protein